MFQISKLSNNLQVVSTYMPGIRSVSINILVTVGSRYESELEHGICHFLEHMAFKGTHNRTYQQIAQEFDTIGGQFNAYTSKEHTVYYAKVLSQHMHIAMDILADILQNSKFDQEEIDKERKVIFQEMAAVQDSPDELVYDNLTEIAFDKQLLGRSILGSKESISRFNTASFQQYTQKHYHSNNMIVSVAGDVVHGDLLKLAQEFFGTIPIGEKGLYDESYYTPGNIMVSKDLEQTNIILGFKGVSYMNELEFYKAQVLSLILGGGLSSRLFQNIREKHGLVYSVGSFNSAYIDSGLFCLYGSTTPENLDNLINELHKEVASICSSIADSELTRAKNQITASMIMAEEKSGYKSETLAKNFAIFGRHINLDEMLQQTSSLKVDDILQIAGSIFSSKLALSAVGPELRLDYAKIAQQFENL
jgi:predicted Zn-dependent peptidase